MRQRAIRVHPDKPPNLTIPGVKTVPPVKLQAMVFAPTVPLANLRQQAGCAQIVPMVRSQVLAVRVSNVLQEVPQTIVTPNVPTAKLGSLRPLVENAVTVQVARSHLRGALVWTVGLEPILIIHTHNVSSVP